MQRYSRHIYWGLIFVLVSMAVSESVFMINNTMAVTDKVNWPQKLGWTLAYLDNSILLMLVAAALLCRSGAAVWLYGFSAFKTWAILNMIYGNIPGISYHIVWSVFFTTTLLCCSALRLLVKTGEISKP